MGRITEDLIRRRAEHNEGCVTTLEELALHQQNIERIELLGQICRHLKILYLQNNLIGKIENLHRLKELEYLNLALNNITRIQNLQRCESVKKLDLTVNFIDKAGLLTIESLNCNIHLKELHLIGNPCVDWHGYRDYVAAKLPNLESLDGKEIKRSERIAARQILPNLERQLREELIAEGVDPDKAAEVEDDGIYDEDAEIPETGYVDENGDMRRPWCPATRLLEHRESVQQDREKDERQKKSQSNVFNGSNTPQRRTDFPELKDGELIRQKNEGNWDFTLDESENGSAIVLDVSLNKYMDSSFIQADVQPNLIRLLVKGRLLQLILPCQVKVDSSVAQRSTTTGHLVVTMPKENLRDNKVDIACIRPSETKRNTTSTPMQVIESIPEIRAPNGNNQKKKSQGVNIRNIVPTKEAGGFAIKEVQRAKIQQSALEDEDDDDYIPPL